MSNFLTDTQLRRYARHVMLEQMGEAGQKKLLNSSVLVIGAGGLGSAVISYLAAAGIGRIGIVDHDRVELSNLARQSLHETGDIGRLKVESARDRVHEINPDVRVECYPKKFTATNADTLVSQYDIVADGCDNFETRLLVNAACHRHKKPLVSAAIRGFEGQISTFKSYLGAPCYECFVSNSPPEARDCAENGVIGPLCGVMGSMQALETIKELLDIGDSLSGSLLFYNALKNDWRKVVLRADPACKICGSAKAVA